MMQRLRFRGGSPASPSPGSRADALGPGPGPGRGGRTPPSKCVTPGSLGPARPLRLVYCDDDGKFLMDPEAVATLQLVKGPVAVVSVCGRARQGKSFILNQLLGRSSGFQVASTHRPCTKGLWMWSAPLHQTTLDGTEYNLLLLDTEGIDAYDQTARGEQFSSLQMMQKGTYSTQIFSLAVLLSSMFIYNQMGGIDEAALDSLSLVTEMTKHVRVRATGGRSTASELAQFSPVFVWLLRDFYLDLAEEGQKITPRDYLELALRPVQGRRTDISSKNEIRESIRSLFPDRDCFALVRPLNNEIELQQLDQIPLDRLRPEFRSGLDALTKYIFEHTKPKQVGRTMMTGPVLAAITQSFLDAMNNGAVPTILSSWQGVEEAECRRAYDSAIEVYMSSFDRTKSAEEALLEEAQDEAVKRSLASFNAAAVGTGSARMMYEKLLQNFLKKAFEDYKQSAFLDANFRCSNTVQLMEKKLREDCHRPDARIDNIVKSLDNMLSDYEISCHGPSKWRSLSTFLKQCLEGPVIDLLKQQLNRIDSERSSLALKYRSNEDKLELLKKQLKSNEKHRSEYLKRYEDAVSDKQKTSGDLSARVVNLQSKCSTLEEHCMGLSKDLDLVRNESSSWRIKHDLISSEFKTKEEMFKSQKGAIESRLISIEANLGAARDQALSAQEDASEWKMKYENTAREAKMALERAEFCEEQAKKKAQEREDAISGEFCAQLVEKEEEIKYLNVKLEQTDSKASALIIKLEAAESDVLNHDFEVLALKNEMRDLIQKLDSVKAITQSYEKESKILEQEKNHLKEKYLSICKKSEDAEERSKIAERSSRKAVELTEAALAEAACNQKERNEMQQLALERLTVIEKFEKQIDRLEQERERLMIELGKLHQSQLDTLSKVASLERHVDEREEEIEELMSCSNEQRSSTVHVLESLLATERAARAEASRRAEALSLQLQTTQHKLDALQQELTSTRLNETALDSRLRTVSHGKRPRVDAQGMESDEGAARGRKRSRSPTSPLKCVEKQDGSVLQRWRKFITKSGNSTTGM